MVVEKDKVFVTMIGTEPGSGKGGISTAMEMFGKCFKESGLGYDFLTIHFPQQGKFNNIYAFIRCFPFLIKLKFLSNNRHQYLYLHVGPKGSLLRKLLVAAFGRAIGFKIVSHYHSPAFEKYLSSGGVMSYVLRYVFLLSHTNLVLSEWWAKVFSSKGLCGAEIIPNCLDGGGGTTQNSVIENSIRVFSMGRLVVEKNFSAVIESLKYLPSSTSLYIAGDGPFKKDLESYSRKLGVSERVFFLGWLNDDEKYAQLSRASVFALPSQYDSFGMVFIESLAMGCPVVTGPNPAVMSALDELKGVFVSEDYSGINLASSISDLMFRGSSKVAVRESVLNRYGISVVSEKLKKVFIEEWE